MSMFARGGGSREKYSSQRVNQNLKTALLCGTNGACLILMKTRDGISVKFSRYQPTMALLETTILETTICFLRPYTPVCVFFFIHTIMAIKHMDPSICPACITCTRCLQMSCQERHNLSPGNLSQLDCCLQ